VYRDNNVLSKRFPPIFEHRRAAVPVSGTAMVGSEDSTHPTEAMPPGVTLAGGIA